MKKDLNSRKLLSNIPNNAEIILQEGKEKTSSIKVLYQKEREQNYNNCFYNFLKKYIFI